MAGIPGAVYMIIAWSSASMAFTDNIGSYTLTQTFIENEILTDKTRFKGQLFYGLCVCDYPSMKLVDITEAMMTHLGTCLFTAHATCAV